MLKDIEQITKEIREEIKNKNLHVQLPEFESVPIQTVETTRFDYGALMSQLGEMHRTLYINVHRPMQANPVKALIQKVLRKFMMFFVGPLVADQNEFNANVTRFGQEVAVYIEAQREKDAATIQMLEQRLKKLEDAVKKIEGK